MASPSPIDLPEVPPPPAIRAARSYFVLAALALGLALVGLGVAPSVGFAGLVIGGVFAWSGWIVRRNAWPSAITQVALRELTRGRLEHVEALHARIPTSALRRGTVARAVAIQRALLALFRGAPDAAIAALGPAVDPSAGILNHSVERFQRASALGVRAVAHAMVGDAAKAEADATEAASLPEAGPDALARGELARALVAARRGQTEVLADRLARHGSLMLEHTMPRERALVRALRKMARARGRSVYREPARPAEEAPAPGGLAGWIARVAPEAAAYAGEASFAERAGVEAAVPVASPEAARAVARARGAAVRATPKPRRWALALGVLGAALVMTSVLPSIQGGVAPGEEVVEAPSSLAGGAGVALLLVVVVVATLAFQIRRARRLNTKLLGAQRAVALGDAAAAEAILREATSSALPLFASAARCALARVAEQRADFEACLAECDRAIALVGSLPASRAAASEQLLPTAIALRALALAATCRPAEADAELAALHQGYPAYAFLAASSFRVRLVKAARAGDWAAAREVARERTAELPIPLRDDVLADLVLATEPGGLPREEREGLDAELRESDALRTWIDAVAPGLRDALAGPAQRPRVAEEQGTPVDDGDELEEPAGRRAALTS